MNSHTLRIHAHCQAPQANTLTKACQRVCLADRTGDRSDVENWNKMIEENEHQLPIAV